jgi:hypothetical protein
VSGALIERLEKAEAGSQEIDAEICVALQYGGLNSEGGQNIRTDADWEGDLIYEIGAEECCCPIPAVTTSLDAALALAERVCPDMRWSAVPNGYGGCTFGFHVPRGWGNNEQWGSGRTPALAACIAILKAVAAQPAATQVGTDEQSEGVRK